MKSHFPISLLIAQVTTLSSQPLLSGYFASSPKARQELNRFIVSGVDSTTNSYDFSASLQETYAKNTLGYTLMSEYLTGTSDHGVYQFSRPTASWQRKVITYNVRWSLEKEDCLIVRDARAEANGQEDTFYVLESFWLEEADHDPSKTRFSLAGEQLDASGIGKSVVKEEFWDISINPTTSKRCFLSCSSVVSFTTAKHGKLFSSCEESYYSDQNTEKTTSS